MAKASEERILPPFKQTITEGPTEEDASEPANSNEYIFFGLAHNQAMPLGFKIIFAAGNMAAIHYYHDLISPFEFDGSGLIKLRTPSLTLKITGKNLQALFDHLFESRIAWIKEPHSSFTQTPENQPEIESIAIEYEK